MGNGCCNHIARATAPAIIGDELDNRMGAIFEASGEMIYQASRQLIANYAVDGVCWEHSAAGVGKALLVNGVSALVASMGDMTPDKVTELCDEITDFLSGRVLEQLETEPCTV